MFYLIIFQFLKTVWFSNFLAKCTGGSILAPLGARNLKRKFLQSHKYVVITLTFLRSSSDKVALFHITIPENWNLAIVVYMTCIVYQITSIHTVYNGSEIDRSFVFLFQPHYILMYFAPFFFRIENETSQQTHPENNM